MECQEAHEYVSKKIQELCAVIAEHNPDQKLMLVEYAIRELMNWGCSNHYESMGVAQEALLEYRDIAKQVHDEECDCDCEEEDDENGK